jgi:ribosomal protein L37E
MKVKEDNNKQEITCKNCGSTSISIYSILTILGYNSCHITKDKIETSNNPGSSYQFIEVILNCNSCGTDSFLSLDKDIFSPSSSLSLTF